LELTLFQKETIRHQFDCFCKKVLRGEVKDYQRSMMARARHEKLFSELSDTEEKRCWIEVEDEYPSDKVPFIVSDVVIEVENHQLAGILQSLPEEKKNIVLLAYFLGMNDGEIAQTLHMVRRTVNYQRNSALQEIKKGWKNAKSNTQ